MWGGGGGGARHLCNFKVKIISPDVKNSKAYSDVVRGLPVLQPPLQLLHTISCTRNQAWDDPSCSYMQRIAKGAAAVLLCTLWH